MDVIVTLDLFLGYEYVEALGIEIFACSGGGLSIAGQYGVMLSLQLLGLIFGWTSAGGWNKHVLVGHAKSLDSAGYGMGKFVRYDDTLAFYNDIALLLPRPVMFVIV
jgi:hypothetical protein